MVISQQHLPVLRCGGRLLPTRGHEDWEICLQQVRGRVEVSRQHTGVHHTAYHLRQAWQTKVSHACFRQRSLETTAVRKTDIGVLCPQSIPHQASIIDCISSTKPEFSIDPGVEVACDVIHWIGMVKGVWASWNWTRCCRYTWRYMYVRLVSFFLYRSYLNTGLFVCS